MTTVSVSMATRSSNLEDQKSGVQTEGHIPTLPSSCGGPEETVAFGSAPPIHHPSLWQGGKHQTTLRLGLVWKYK